MSWFFNAQDNIISVHELKHVVAHFGRDIGVEIDIFDEIGLFYLHQIGSWVRPCVNSVTYYVDLRFQDFQIKSILFFNI